MESSDKKRKISSYDDLWSDEEKTDDKTGKKSRPVETLVEKKNADYDKEKEKQKHKEKHERPKGIDRGKEKERNHRESRDSIRSSSRDSWKNSRSRDNFRDSSRPNRKDERPRSRDDRERTREERDKNEKDDRKDRKEKLANGKSKPEQELKALEEKRKKEEEEYKKRVEEQMRSMNEVKEEDPEEEARKRRERREAILRKHQRQESGEEDIKSSSDGDEKQQSEIPSGLVGVKENQKTELQIKDTETESQVIEPEEGELREMEEGEMEEKVDDYHVFKDMDLEILRLRKQEDDQMFENEEGGSSDMFAPMDERELLEEIPLKRSSREAGQGEEEERSEPVVSDGHGLNNERQDDFDMFSESPNHHLASVQVPKLSTAAISAANYTAEVTDDADGYYCFRIGEILNGKYSVLGSYGKGVFSTVLRAIDLTDKKEVAIKILRNNEAMKKMGLKEIQLLKDLHAADPANKYNCISLLDHFYDRDHLCLVFEAMLGGNLREVLKKYGTKIGLSLKAVKIYGQKMMLALKLLKKCKILHADIKLDNILVNESKTSIKLGDFGSASPANENGITPYLVSRFYRAPEIVLGHVYSYGIDMWSVGCCLYEIATGKILFPGKSNNEMIYFFMEVAGPVSKKMQRKGEFTYLHFDETGNFRRVLNDRMTKKEYVKVVNVTKPTRDLKEELLNSPFNLSAEEKQMALHLHDLLSKIFVIDPSNRITVEEALRHPFFFV